MSYKETESAKEIRRDFDIAKKYLLKKSFNDILYMVVIVPNNSLAEQ